MPASTARKRRRRSTTTTRGAVLWDGPSQLTGEPIVALATGLGRPSSNAKTGPMAQVWFLPRDRSPIEAKHADKAAAVCGSCPVFRLCYVRGDTPHQVWAAYQRGTYQEGEEPGTVSRRYPVRLGAWGDPASVPLHVLNRATWGARLWTGYTHQWRTCAPEYAALAMASVESVAQRRRARARGFRTFRIRWPHRPFNLQPGEVVCPYETHRVPCSACGLCNGGAPGSGPDIVTTAHGPRIGRS